MSAWSDQLEVFLRDGNHFVGEEPKIKGNLYFGAQVKQGNNRCTFGKNITLKGARITYYDVDACLSVGNNCVIEAYLGLGTGCTIDIADNTVFNGHVMFKLAERTKISIGKNCLFAGGLYMTTTDWHSIIDMETGERINPSKDITIEDHVWIAEDVKILKGVTIGHDSIIGAGSVVTGNVPSNVIVAGVPARIIKTGVTWQRELI